MENLKTCAQCGAKFEGRARLYKAESPAEILKLQIELRKLELAHQKELAVLASEEKQRERRLFQSKTFHLRFTEPWAEMLREC